MIAADSISEKPVMASWNNKAELGCSPRWAGASMNSFTREEPRVSAG